MVKAYLRYEPKSSFGIISSPACNTVFDADARYAVCPALSDVIVWDAKKGVQIVRWYDTDSKAQVTCIARSPNKVDFAVGYSDGSVRIFNLKSQTTDVVFNGHRNAVTALAFDPTGTILASGSRDTDLILWDVVGEAGLFRLRGHKDEITRIAFVPDRVLLEQLRLGAADLSSLAAESRGYLITSSKDTLVKVWDLQSRHCVQTLVTHRSEVWSLAISPDYRILVTGSSEPTLKVWKLELDRLHYADKKDPAAMQGEEAQADVGKLEVAIEYGSLTRHSRERVQQLMFHPSGAFLMCASADRSVELWRVREHDEIRKKIARRLKRQREKLKKAAGGDVSKEEDQLPHSADDMEIQVADELTPYQVIRARTKVNSVEFSPAEADPITLRRQGHARVLLALADNTIEVYNIALPPKGSSRQNPPQDPQSAYVLDRFGHRSEPRVLALSNDNELIASASNGTLKVWNSVTNACLRTMECGQAMCAAFLPDDQYVLVGTKKGKLQLFNIPSSTLVEEYDAHAGTCWSMHVQFDKKGVVTGGGDKEVKFWDFELTSSQSSTAGPGALARRRLTLVHSRTLKMSDEVLCVRFSPDMKLLAVALLDTTVKVFYADSLKFFLSLYGHKLPVLSMDISSDSTLLVTASADKNVKIWGLDFGDCHRSLFAHQEAVTAVQFVWGTHYFFSAGKDRVVQQWDGDKFVRIQKLEGSFGEIWALAVAKHGNFVVASSQDRAIRIWEKTDEPLFLEEEQERELEEMYESGLAASLDRAQREAGISIERHGSDDEGGGNADVDELGMAGKQTMETLKAGERIIEALDLADEERKKWADYERDVARGLHVAPPSKNPVLIAMGNVEPARHVLQVIERVRPSDLEDALLVLPFTKVLSLLPYIDLWAQK
ncbi:beta transducin, partial [Spiromyces aspiralis]